MKKLFELFDGMTDYPILDKLIAIVYPFAAVIIACVWAGSMSALFMAGPITFLLVISFVIISIIVLLLYYLYPKQCEEKLDEIKKLSRRGLHKLQEAIDVLNNHKM